MTAQESTKEKLTFTDWYANEYRAGPINEDNYSECAAYLEGLLDTGEWSEEAKSRLDRCISTLRGGGNVIECLKRYGIKQP